MSQILNWKRFIARMVNENCNGIRDVCLPEPLLFVKRDISQSAVNLKRKDSDKCKKSAVRHNYNNKSEIMISKQVNMEFYAAYWYTSLQHHFDRDDIALPGFSQFFRAAAIEELEHAEKFMVFQMKRGGQLRYSAIEAPPSFEWTPAIAIAESIELEKQVTKSIEDMASQADNCGDHHLNDFLCGEYLIEQYQAIKDLGNLLTRIKRAGPGTGLIIVDGELQEKIRRKEKN